MAVLTKLKWSGFNQLVSRMNGNTQFVGLSVIFGESARINVWPFITSSEHQSETQPDKNKVATAAALILCLAICHQKIVFIWHKRQNYQDKQKTYKTNADEPAFKNVQSNLTILLCSVIQAKHSSTFAFKSKAKNKLTSTASLMPLTFVNNHKYLSKNNYI